jgi:hypothetical protein
MKFQFSHAGHKKRSRAGRRSLIMARMLTSSSGAGTSRMEIRLDRMNGHPPAQFHAHFHPRHHGSKHALRKALTAAATALMAEYLPVEARAEIQNGPITPASVETNGTATAIQLPSGSNIGEPGIVVNQLGADELPSRIVTILAGRTSGGGGVNWNGYLDDFKINLYTVDGYTNAALPFATISLAAPVDQSDNAITTVQDGSNVLPNTPAFAQVSTSTNTLVNTGYWFGFNLTTNSNEVNSTTALIPQSALTQMQSGDFVMGFYVVSDRAGAGGVALGIQDAGFGQGALNQGVFASNTQAPGFVGDPSASSYAIEFHTVPEPVPAIAGMGAGMIGVTNTWLGETNWLESAFGLAGPWSTVTSWVAGASFTNLPVAMTNDLEFFRVSTWR